MTLVKTQWAPPRWRVRTRGMAIFMTGAAATMLGMTVYALATIGWSGAVGLIGVAMFAAGALREWRGRRAEVSEAQEFDTWMTRNG